MEDADLESYCCGAFLFTVSDKCISLHIEDLQGRELVSRSFAYKCDNNKGRIKLIGKVPKVLKGWLRVCQQGPRLELWNSRDESVALLSRLVV